MLGRIILTSTGPAGELRSSATAEEAEKSLVGTKGEALSRLRPSGRAEFGDKILDVVTEGEFLEAGTVIQVLKVEGNRVVVKKSE
jgi:membrane-bound serine protease (ClpP class)